MTVPTFSISLGWPSGPMKLVSESPLPSVCRCRVDVPTAWTTMVMVPASRSKSAMVSGILSPSSWIIRMMNCPAWQAAATAGASMTCMYTSSE